jgi:hypothetical protein
LFIESITEYLCVRWGIETKGVIMTLVVTELSDVGIAMAADSAITRLVNGRIIEVDQQGWLKLLRVPRINAAVSYWGNIGLITRVQFDTWMQRIIETENYNDLGGFAERVSIALNIQCQNHPLPNGNDVGIHVTGYSQWADGVRRPTFYHVHNGHGTFNIREERDEKGRLISVIPNWQSEPRGLFEVHHDFPYLSKPIDENIAILHNGYITRNGAFFIYAVLWEHLQRALGYINLIPNVSLPRDLTDLRSRKGFLHTMLEMIIQFYRCSNQSRIIGGTVTSLGIGPSGYV